MAGGGLRIRVRIEGADEVIRALRDLPDDATQELRREAFDIADYLVDKMKYAAAAEGGHARRAASTLRAVRDRFPIIQASNTGRGRGMLFGSEFGMNRRSGWYAASRYEHSLGRQYKPHLGAHSYWFFRTAEREQGWVSDQWNQAADAVIRRWSA